jgi:tetratricopeptide (TPR) repeat protein
MMYLAVREDDIGRAESLVARVGKDYGDSAMFAVVERDTATLARLLAEASKDQDIGQVVGAARQVGRWLWDLTAAEPFLRIAAGRPEQPGRANLQLARNQAAQGRWMSADSAFVKASQASNAPEAPLLRGITAALPFLAVPRSDLDAIRTEISAWNPGRPAAGSGPAAELLPQLRLYALGLLASRLGDTDGALRHAAQLETASVAAEDTPVVRSFAAAIRADVALAAHRPADALKALEAVRGQVPFDLTLSAAFGEEYPRLLRADALLATGKDLEARRWLENGLVGTPNDLLFLAQRAFRLGDIYERAGEKKKAIDSYAQFIRLWKSCDPRLRPAVEEARARLARLTAEPGA